MRSTKKAAVVLGVALLLAQSVLIIRSAHGQDCNLNGTLDADDISNCVSDPACADCNSNNIPDACDLAPILDYAAASSFDPGLPATSQPDIVVAAQINSGTTTGDTLPDLVVGDFNSNQIRFLINDGAGMPSGDSASATVGSGVHDLVTADFNNDGLMDVATANFSGGLRDVSVLLRTDTGGELPLSVLATHYDLCTGNCGSTGITYGDFDGDSFLDLAVSTIGTDEVIVMINDGVSSPGAFTEGQNISLPGANPFRVLAADVIGTSDMDLVVTMRDSGTGIVNIYPGDGTGAFDTGAGLVTLTPDCGAAVDCGPFGVVAVQLDGANGTDLVTSNQDFDTVSVWLENGAGGFTETQFDAGDQPIDVEVADLDGDSDLDIATANSGDDSLSVLLNDGTNQFFDPFLGLTGVSELATGDNPRTLVIADLDDDGVPDLASTDQNDSQISLFVGSLPAATEQDCQPDGVPDSCGVGCGGNQAPVATCVATLTRCPDGMGQAALVAADVNDGSFDPDGDDIVITIDPASPGPNYSDQEVVTLRVTETSTQPPLESTCTVVLTVSASSLSLTCPSDVADVMGNASCEGDIPDVTGDAVPQGACSGSPTISQSPLPGTTVAVGVHTLTLTVDDAGNMAQCMVDVEVVDGVAPVISIPGDNPLVIQCGDPFVDPNPSALDECDGTVAVIVSASDVDTSTGGMYTVDYEATDAAGNIGTATLMVDVQDSVDPVITCPADVTVIADTLACTYAGTFGMATATDNCGTPTISNDAPGELPLGANVVTWTATDGAGNTATCMQTVTVTDQVSGGGAGVSSLSFNTLADVDILESPINVWTEDLNKDGRSDIAIGYVSLSLVHVLVSNGDGTFTDQGTFTTGQRVFSAAFADLNNDTHMDIVTANDNAGPGTPARHVTVLLNTSASALPLTYSSTHIEVGDGSLADAASGLVVADLVGSSAPDIAVTSRDTDKVTVLENDGSASFSVFQAFQETAMVNELFRLGAVDADSDNDLDLIAIGRDTDNALVYRNDEPTGGMFVAEATLITLGNLGVNDRPNDLVTVVDVDLDGLDDFVTANDVVGGGSFTVALNQSGGIDFGATEDFATGPSPFSVRLDDFNCDNILDVVTTSDDDGGAYIHVGSTTIGNPAFDSGTFFATGANAAYVAVADYNDDGVPDLAVVNFGDDTLTVLLNTSCTAPDDCNNNGTVDNCDIAANPDLDMNLNGQIDSCEGGAPVAVCQDVTVSADASPGCTAVVTAQDVDDGSSGDNIALSLSPVGPYPIGDTAVVLTVTDQGGLMSTCNATITVVDDTIPVVTCPDDATFEANTLTCSYTGDIGTPVVDDCSLTGLVVSSDAPAELPLGTTTVTWTVTDGAGNEATCEQMVTVTDEPQGDGGADCDSNNRLDVCDIATDPTLDENPQNGVLDICEGPDCNNNQIPDQDELGGNDCNSNQIPDDCELVGNDCNTNGIPDDCELAGNDCNGDMVPDDCQLVGNDCNNDQIPDDCELTSNDCNSNQVPDECEILGNDCNGDLIPDDCQLAGGDCNSNQVPDECELTANDCNSDGVPDDCQLAGNDCNNNNTPDDCELAGNDCNLNNRPDECDISSGISQDTPPNGIPDECEVGDCNNNEVDDALDISNGTSQDCNNNDIPDECDIGSGNALDCNSNGIPDTCDIAAGTSLDCNLNNVPDDCDISSGVSMDCNSNGVPDVCDLALGAAADCNANNVPDSCDIASGTSDDCDNNGVPDDCESGNDCNNNDVSDACDISSGTEMDCDNNGVPDSCDVATADCNVNGLVDQCEILSGTAKDCNSNFLPDQCDIASGFSQDADLNGVPDECEGSTEELYQEALASAQQLQALGFVPQATVDALIEEEATLSSDEEALINTIGVTTVEEVRAVQAAGGGAVGGVSSGSTWLAIGGTGLVMGSLRTDISWNNNASPCDSVIAANAFVGGVVSGSCDSVLVGEIFTDASSCSPTPDCSQLTVECGTYQIQCRQQIGVVSVMFNTPLESICANCSEIVGRQVPGDCNQDGEIDIADPVCLLDVLFRGGRTLPCGVDEQGSSLTSIGNITLMDANGQAGVDLSDAVLLLRWLFNGGPPHVLAVPGDKLQGCIQIFGCPDNEICSF